MKKITKKILSTSLALSFLFVAKISNAADFKPSSYINTIFAMNLCGPGSTVSTCVDPVILGANANGIAFDLGSTTAGSSAGEIGNLTNAKVGTTYSYGQVILSRSFTVTGEAAAPGGSNRCRTESDNAFGGSSAVAGANDTAAAESQVIGVPTGSSLPLNMQGTTSTNGTNGSDDPAGTITANSSNMKFRFALTKPLILKPGALPTFTVAFDLSKALEFNTVGSTVCVATPGSPEIDASFSN